MKDYLQILPQLKATLINVDSAYNLLSEKAPEAHLQSAHISLLSVIRALEETPIEGLVSRDTAINAYWLTLFHFKPKEQFSVLRLTRILTRLFPCEDASDVRATLSPPWAAVFDEYLSGRRSS